MGNPEWYYEDILREADRILSKSKKIDIIAGKREPENKILSYKSHDMFPSSIHEVIAIPNTNGMDISKCKSIVKMINGDANCISPEFVLSYNIFLIQEVNGNIFVDIK